MRYCPDMLGNETWIDSTYPVRALRASTPNSVATGLILPNFLISCELFISFGSLMLLLLFHLREFCNYSKEDIPGRKGDRRDKT